MANEKFDKEYSAILMKKQHYMRNLRDIVNSSIKDEEKKKILFLFVKKINDLILDAKKIYHDTKSSNREVEFEQSKQVYVDCLKLQNLVFENLCFIEEQYDRALAFRYDSAILTNNNLINKISQEFVFKNENLS